MTGPNKHAPGAERKPKLVWWTCKQILPDKSVCGNKELITRGAVPHKQSCKQCSIRKARESNRRSYEKRGHRWNQSKKNKPKNSVADPMGTINLGRGNL